MTSVDNILDILKEIDKTATFSVFIPSLNREVKFKQLNTHQFKEILKTVIDSPIYNTQFIIMFNSVVKQNCLEDIDTSNLTILDKLFIFYKMRIESISSEYTFNSSIVNLLDNYNNIIQNFQNIEPKNFVYEGYSITCKVPTIETENKLEKELHQNINISIDTPEKFRKILGETFINEITKFISFLKVKDAVINFDDLDFKSRIKIVEKLPAPIINDILKYIESYKTVVNNLTTFNITLSDSSIIQKEIPIDATFYNM